MPPSAELLSLPLIIAFEKMIQRRGEYLTPGREREAHGLGAGLLILWTVMSGEETASITTRGAL
jgi:hypothetical protein